MLQGVAKEGISDRLRVRSSRLTSALVILGLFTAQTAGATAIDISGAVLAAAGSCDMLPPFLMGVTLTPDWEDFPGPSASGCFEPRYDGNPSNWWEQLDATATVYVKWANAVWDQDPENQSIYEVNETLADLYGGFEPPDFSDATVVEIADDGATLYYGCETPTPALNDSPLFRDVDGEWKIHVRDIFGGHLEGRRIALLKMHYSFEGCTPVLLVFGWDHPGTYSDEHLSENVDAHPGDIVNDRVDYDFGIAVAKIFVPQLTVMAASCDFNPTSPGYVDAGDVGAYSSLGTSTVNWGFGTTDGLGSGHNFRFNVNPFGSSASSFDSGDISVLATRLGDDDCGDSKAGTSRDTRENVLQWFGIAVTGETVVARADGATIPEYTVVDFEQNRRAIADPYGYRLNGASVRAADWGLVKKLYR